MVDKTKELFERDLQRLMKTLQVKTKPRCVLINKTSDAKKFGVSASIFARVEGGTVVPLLEYGGRGYLVYISKPDPYVVVAEAAHVMNSYINKRLKIRPDLKIGEAFDRLEQFKLALRKRDKKKVESLTKQFRKSYYDVCYPKGGESDPHLTDLAHRGGEALAFAAIKAGFNTTKAISELQLALSRKKKIRGRDISGYDAMDLVELWEKKGQKFSKFVKRAKKRRIIRRI